LAGKGYEEIKIVVGASHTRPGGFNDDVEDAFATCRLGDQISNLAA
jgi:hypothetical protein